MKEPLECRNIEDIRQEIDRLDREIISLISKRKEYVVAATQFKTSEEDVLAVERQNEMHHKRNNWAKELNIEPELIQSVYKKMLSYFTQMQMGIWQKQK